MEDRLTNLLRKSALGAVAVALLAFSAVPELHAADDCQRRVARADHRLHVAIERHGRQSRQAERARHDLHEVRERCWSGGHRWWDEHERRWRTERDWDDRDHDHDDHR
jgi:hypothetical protein